MFAFVLWDVGIERTRMEIKSWQRERRLLDEIKRKKKDRADKT